MPTWPKRKHRPGVDEYGRTPLWNFALAGDLARVQRELAGGADPKVGDDVGYTALHVAIQEGHVDIVELLLQSGADPNQADVHGNVPLWVAVDNEGGDDQIILMLLRSGADARIKNKYGRSPFTVLKGMPGAVGKLVAKVGPKTSTKKKPASTPSRGKTHRTKRSS